MPSSFRERPPSPPAKHAHKMPCASLRFSCVARRACSIFNHGMMAARRRRRRRRRVVLAALCPRMWGGGGDAHCCCCCCCAAVRCVVVVSSRDSSGGVSSRLPPPPPPPLLPLLLLLLSVSPSSAARTAVGFSQLSVSLNASPRKEASRRARAAAQGIIGYVVCCSV